MGILNPDHAQKNVIRQPQLSRNHFSYRSPMKSEQMNLHMAQLRFDICNSYATYETLERVLIDYLSDLRDGVTFDDITISAYVEDASPSYTNSVLTIQDIETIAERLANLYDRLEVLEKGLYNG